MEQKICPDFQLLSTITLPKYSGAYTYMVVEIRVETDLVHLGL